MAIRGTYWMAALAAVLLMKQDQPSLFSLGGMTPSEIVGGFKKSLNGGRKGRSVKGMARKASKRRAVSRARRLGHA